MLNHHVTRTVSPGGVVRPSTGSGPRPQQPSKHGMAPPGSSTPRKGPKPCPLPPLQQAPRDQLMEQDKAHLGTWGWGFPAAEPSPHPGRLGPLNPPPPSSPKRPSGGPQEIPAQESGSRIQFSQEPNAGEESWRSSTESSFGEKAARSLVVDQLAWQQSPQTRACSLGGVRAQDRPAPLALRPGEGPSEHVGPVQPGLGSAPES